MEELTLAAFVIGGTQVVKDLGLVNGQWLKAVAVVLGGLGGYLVTFDPALWEQMTGLVVALSGTGGVSFLKQLLNK